VSDATEATRNPLWLKILYAVLAVATLAMITMLLKEVIQRVEGEEGELHHLPVDAAWLVFLPSAGISLLAAIVLFPVGLIRKDRRLTRYGRSVAVLAAAAAAAVVVEELLVEPQTPDEHEQHPE
jgi:hypothetical protein